MKTFRGPARSQNILKHLPVYHNDYTELDRTISYSF